MLWPDDLAHQVVWGYHWNEPLTSVWSTSLSLIYTISDALSPEAHTHLKPHSTTENTRAHTHNFYVVRKRLSHLSAYFPILLICLIAKRQEGKMSHLNLERRWKRCGVPLKVCLSHHDTHSHSYVHTFAMFRAGLHEPVIKRDSGELQSEHVHPKPDISTSWSSLI